MIDFLDLLLDWDGGIHGCTHLQKGILRSVHFTINKFHCNKTMM